MLGAALLAEVTRLSKCSALLLRGGGVWRPRGGSGSTLQTAVNGANHEDLPRMLLAVPPSGLHEPGDGARGRRRHAPETTSRRGRRFILNGQASGRASSSRCTSSGLSRAAGDPTPAPMLGTDSVRRAELHTLRALSGPEIASAIGTRSSRCRRRGNRGLKDDWRRSIDVRRSKPATRWRSPSSRGEEHPVVAKGKEVARWSR